MTTQFLAGWALRSSLLILCGALLLKALRVKDPSVRLAAWTAMLLGSLAIPLLSITVPAMPVTTRTVAVAQAPAHYVAPAPVVRREIFVDTAPKRFDWQRAAIFLYEAIAAALFLRLSLGLLMSWRLLHSSLPTGEPGVRESDRVSSPVTLGVVRPVVVLPIDWPAWSETKLAAVLAHERSHIRRHDPAVQVLSAIHRALLWYSPLSWYLDRQIVRLAEEASDDAAIAAISDRASYAETLLEFMQRGVRRTSWQGVPMARYGHPERRIDHILDATTLSRGVTRWSIAAIVALAMPLAYVIAAAQEKLTFEAASVKVAESGGGSGGMVTARKTAGSGPGRRDEPTGGPGTTDPGRIHYPMVTARFVLTTAYGVDDHQIVGPDWLDRVRFDIDATMPAGTTKEQFRTMLQNLLADRLKLESHRETRDFSGFSLVVGKGGPKLKKSAEPTTPQEDGAPDPQVKPGPDGYFPPPDRPGMFLQVAGMPGTADARANFRQVTMLVLAKILQNQLKRPVADDTGLTAKYDFILNFSTQGISLGSGPIRVSMGDGEPPHQLDLAGALQAQLGLKLEAKKVSQEVVIIDRMEKTPREN